MTVETKAKFAARLGRSRSYITRLGQAGRLVLTPGNMVVVEDSIVLIDATRDQQFAVEERWAQERAAKLAAAAAAPAPPDPPPAAADPEEPQPEPGADAAAATLLREIGQRTRHAKMLSAEADARSRARDDLLAAGQIIWRHEVQADLAVAVGLILAVAETLPDRLAPLLVGQQEPATVRAILHDEVETFRATVAAQLRGVAAAGQ